MNERERIHSLMHRFEGIGDDCAILEPPNAKLVWTVDAQVDGTHFRTEWLSWEDIGFRSFMAAASDLAAMGATPIGALSALVLTPQVGDDAFDRLTLGQAEAAALVKAPIMGGNLARGTETSITTTLLGQTGRPVPRSGARPGEHVLLGGVVGVAAAGLAFLERGVRSEPAIEVWRRPLARLDLGVAMREIATAAVDVSDGLARDAGHVAEASGVMLVLDEPSLREAASADFADAAKKLGLDPLDLMLHGGEDYALVVTSPRPIEGFVPIGVVEQGTGVVLRQQNGSRRPIEGRGFDHFSPK